LKQKALDCTVWRSVFGRGDRTFASQIRQWIIIIIIISSHHLSWSLLKADHSLPSSADVEKERSYKSTQPIRCHALCRATLQYSRQCYTPPTKKHTVRAPCYDLRL